MGTLPRAPLSDSTDPVWSWGRHPRPVSPVGGAGAGRQGRPCDLLHPQQVLGPNACAHDHPPERLQGWHRPLPISRAWVAELEGQPCFTNEAGEQRPGARDRASAAVFCHLCSFEGQSDTSCRRAGGESRLLGHLPPAPPTCRVKLVIVERVCALGKPRSASSPPHSRGSLCCASLLRTPHGAGEGGRREGRASPQKPKEGLTTAILFRL